MGTSLFEPDPKGNEWINEMISIEPTKLWYDDNDESINDDDDEKQGEERGKEYVELYKMKSRLQNDEAETSTNLVVPPGTRGAWNQLLVSRFATFKQEPVCGFRTVVIGSPGVGKSRSINYAIRQIIKRVDELRITRPSLERPTIIFEHRKDNTVWLFRPKGDDTNRYEALSTGKLGTSLDGLEDLLEKRETFYIIDAADVEESRMQSLVNATTIFVCSPDRQHYSEFTKHVTSDSFYIPGWTRGAILRARKEMVSDTRGAILRAREEMDSDTEEDLSHEVVSGRIDVVGPIPRRVFASTKEYNSWKEAIMQASLPANAYSVNLVLQNTFSEYEKGGSATKKPASSIVYIDVIGSDYTECVLRIVSSFAAEYIPMNAAFAILKAIMDGNEEVGLRLRKAFEGIVRRLLHRSGWNATVTRLKWEDGKVVEDKGKSMTIQFPKNEDFPIRMEGKRALLDGYNKIKGLTEKENHPVYLCSNFPFIDAADKRNRGYQITVAKSKTINLTHLKPLREDIGLTTTEPYQLVYITPHGHFLQITNAKEALATEGIEVYKLPIPDADRRLTVWKNTYSVKKKPSGMDLATPPPPKGTAGYHSLSAQGSFSVSSTNINMGGRALRALPLGSSMFPRPLPRLFGTASACSFASIPSEKTLPPPRDLSLGRPSNVVQMTRSLMRSNHSFCVPIGLTQTSFRGSWRQQVVARSLSAAVRLFRGGVLFQKAFLR